MYPTPSSDPEARHWTDHILVKVVVIGIITLALMIPSVMIHELVRERSNRKATVINEVSSKWGQLQTIAGPYISVPYYEEIKKTGSASEWREHTLYYFPKTLSINGSLTPVVRKRSIFEVMLYESELRLTGHFDQPDLQALLIAPSNMIWQKATLHLGITDLSGIGNEVNMKTGDTLFPMTASVPAAIQFPNGLMTNLPSEKAAGPGFDFEIALSLKGSQGIYFIPVANQTNVALTSSWPSPKFEGQFLPDSSEISKEGFKANWKILDINRQISQYWTESTLQPLLPAVASRYRSSGDMTGDHHATLGVELIDPVDHYTKNERTVKYAFLLITLTFVVYFFCEVLKKQKVHPLQYGLVGAALVIFFILLLSFSEYIGFDPAYFISSLSTIILITLYSRTIFTEKRYAGLVGGLLLLQFGFIYIILQLEDFALLAGSIALFAIIALIMYLTRNVKWT
jgi:inner membrane protein